MSATFTICKTCGHFGAQHSPAYDEPHKGRLVCNVDKCYCLDFLSPNQFMETKKEEDG